MKDQEKCLNHSSFNFLFILSDCNKLFSIKFNRKYLCDSFVSLIKLGVCENEHENMDDD